MWLDGIRTAGSTEKLATQSVTNQSTGKVTSTGHRYLTVATGLNYQDTNGVWQPSQEAVDLMPDGTGAAVHGRTKVYFSPNLNTAGAVTLVTRSNRVFQTSLAGLYFFDSASSNRVLLSVTKDCSGEIVPPNQVVYHSVLKSIKADLRLVYAKAGLESDLVLLECPSAPDAFGLNPSTTRLELWHEWLGAPTPSIKTRVLQSVTDPVARASMAEPDLVDQTLDFGDLWFPLGRVFFSDEYLNALTNVPAHIRVANPAADPAETPVAKRWVQSPDGTRSYLIESVPWVSVQPELSSLPAAGQSAGLYRPKGRALAQLNKPVPKKQRRPTQHRLQLASTAYRPKGVVLDYITVSGSQDYEFTSGTTFYLDSTAYFAGTVQLDPGCILKFAPGAYLLCYGAFVFSTDTSSPASILTSRDDDLFGEQISGSTGRPTYAASQAIWPYYISANVSMTRIRWAQIGVQFESPGGTFNNCVLEMCQTGLLENGGDGTVGVNTSTYCGVTTPGDPNLTNACGGDSDGNGLPDVWENMYFGTIGVNPNDDPDGDGLSNYQEYLLGTNPTKPQAADTTGATKLQVYTPLK